MAFDHNNTIYSTGLNNYGQLGLGDTTNQNTPVTTNIKNIVSNIPTFHNTPTKINNLSDITLEPLVNQIVLSQVYTTGLNSNGQLGLSDTLNRTEPQGISIFILNHLKVNRASSLGFIKPVNISGQYVPNSGVYAGTTFVYRVLFSVTSSNVVNYVTEYGTTTSYGTQWSSKSRTISSSEYDTAETILTNLANTEIDALKNELNKKIGTVTAPATETGSFNDVTNGITYYYQTTYSAGTNTGISCVITVTTKWGTSSGSYPNTSATGNYTVDSTTYSSYATGAKAVGTSQRNSLKATLDTVIGSINLPTPNPNATSFVATNGITYYYKTTYTAASYTAHNSTSCKVNIKTEWGTSTNYGNTFGNEDYDVKANNYSNHNTVLATKGSTQRSNLEETLNNVIGSVSVSTEADSFIATNGITYYYRTTYTVGTYTPNSSQSVDVTIKTEWGRSTSYGHVAQTETHTVNASNYKTYVTDCRAKGAAQVTSMKAYVNTIIGEVNIEDDTGTHLATNGITYYYKTIYTTTAHTADASTNCTLTISTVWGKTDSYGVTYTSESVNIDAASYGSYDAVNTETGARQQANLKTYLNTLIDEVTVPNTVYETYTTKSGKDFYLRTTYSKESETNTNYVMNYVTDYGPNTNYNIPYSSKKHTINSANYQTYPTDLANLSSTEFDSLKESALKIWDVTLPSDILYTFTNIGGLTYYLLVKYTQGTTSNSENNITYTASWGTTSENRTANSFSQKTHTVNADNVDTATSDLNRLGNDEIEAMKDFLDIPDVVLPDDRTETYTVNSFDYTLTVSHTKGSNINIVNTVAYIDGIQFGDATTSTFLRTQAEAETELASLVGTKITAMRAACDNSPANVSDTYNVGNVNYGVQTQYSKIAGSTTVSIKTYLDGVQYSSQSANINAGTINTDISNVAATGAAKMTELQGKLAATPNDSSETYSIGGMNFTLEKKYTKAANTQTVTYQTLCDGVQHSTGTSSINASSVDSDIVALKAITTGNIGTLQTELSNVIPTDDVEVVTVNGFKYNLGVQYTKTAGVTQAASAATLDGTIYGSSIKTLSYNTLGSNVTELVTNATNAKSALNTLLQSSPDDSSSSYTVNGFNYTIGTAYSKNAGSTSATVQTLLDGRVFRSQVVSIEVNSLTNDLNGAILAATGDRSTLTTILDDSPVNTDRTPYTVDGFLYYVGVTYSKSAGSQDVTVNIMLDGNVNETYSKKVTNATPDTDISAIVSEANGKVSTLMATLRGIPAESTLYARNGFNFNLNTVYTKNTDMGIITITTYIDQLQYGTPVTLEFSNANIDSYTARGAELIDALKLVVNDVPADFTESHTANGFNYNVGIKYEKEADTDLIYVFQMLDGNKVGQGVTTRFDPDNISAISDRGTAQLTLLKGTLNNNSPANYTQIHTVEGMSFLISTFFSKTAGEAPVSIRIQLDSVDYLSPSTVNYNISDISNITGEAVSKENALKAVLNTAPRNNSSTYTVKRCLFKIEKCYAKNANDATVTTMVKLDNTQYQQYHQENFNINNMSALTTYNDTLADSLQTKLDNVIPEDIHTTYSRSGFNFLIDVYFSKVAGTNLINVEYYIDSADLTSNSNGLGN